MTSRHCRSWVSVLSALMLISGAAGSAVAAEATNGMTAVDSRWIGVNKDAGDKMIQVVLQDANIPAGVLARLNQKKDERILGKDKAQEIEQLAKRHGLFLTTKVNPQLRYNKGDIAFWAETESAAWELELQFAARRLVLLAADDADAVIPLQGDLSHWAASVYAALYKQMRPKWESK